MFAGWDDFYLLVGSASAALVGLLFVVVTLTTSLERPRALRDASLYMTPTVVHFVSVLVTSAAAMVPHAPAWGPGSLLAIWMAGAAVYGVGITVQISRSDLGEPQHWSDIWFYGVYPAVAYSAMVAAAGAVILGWIGAPYAVAGLAVVLLLIGLRNAWDLVTWLAPRRSSL